MTKPIRSVTVNFSDGTQMTLIADMDKEGTAYYMRERIKELDIHTVFIAGGLERKLPQF